MSVLLPDLMPDLKYALRALKKSPGFALVAVLTLALGSSADSAIFSLVDSVLLRPLPGIEDPGQLVSLLRVQITMGKPSLIVFNRQSIPQGGSNRQFSVRRAWQSSTANWPSISGPARIPSASAFRGLTSLAHPVHRWKWWEWRPTANIVRW